MKAPFRSRFFRTLRVTVIFLVLIGAAVWTRSFLTSVESEQAVINAEIMQIRAPIAGILEIESVRPGMFLEKGARLFTITNPRFGDRETVAQFNSLQNLVETIESELTGARHNVEVAELAAARTHRLHQAQLIARVEMEQGAKNLDIAKRVVAAKAEQLARSRERAAEMAQQMAMQKASSITLPEDGLVWSISGKTGESVESNQMVMEIINPSRIWVDAFFAERHIADLRPGLPAVIRSLDGSAAWHGELESIRAGVGRLSYDTSVAVPPPEMAKRQIAVRVEGGWNRPFSEVEFFGVGRSVAVTFLKTPHRRTVGDALKERVDRALWGVKTEAATAQTGR